MPGLLITVYKLWIVLLYQLTIVKRDGPVERGTGLGREFHDPAQCALVVMQGAALLGGVLVDGQVSREAGGLPWDLLKTRSAREKFQGATNDQISPKHLYTESLLRM
jgi:hypothetical protein